MEQNRHNFLIPGGEQNYDGAYWEDDLTNHMPQNFYEPFNTIPNDEPEQIFADLSYSPMGNMTRDTSLETNPANPVWDRATRTSNAFSNNLNAAMPEVR